MACDLKATQQLKAISSNLKQTQQLQQHARKPVEKTQEIKMKWERSNEKAMHKTTRNSPVTVENCSLVVPSAKTE